MKLKHLFSGALCLALVGCALLPKKVEFGQDKVQAFPEKRTWESEVQKQTAQRAAEKADEVVREARTEGALPTVIAPAEDAAVLTRAVSMSLGPPENPSFLEAKLLAQKLDNTVARLDRRIADFKSDNNENAGKKIEGTGIIQMPYLVFAGGVVVLGFIGFIVLSAVWGGLKVFALANPPVAMGMSAVNLGGKALSSGVAQLLKGGEKFKDAVEEKFKDNPEVQEAILRLFKDEHEKAQSPEMQAVVRQLTNP